MSDEIKEEIIEEKKCCGGKKSALTTRQIFIGGIVIGVAILSLVFNGIMFAKLQASASNDGAVANVPAQPSPTPTPTAPPANIVQTFNITKDDHVRGDFNAPITLVEFSDFECPFCAKHAPTIAKILADYPGKVRLVYKYFPLSFHPNSQKAAESAECAGEQGKFWEMHDKLFAEQPNGFSTDKFKQWAKELGLDTTKFNSCVDSDKYAAKIKSDMDEGSAKGVNGTPATFVNGTLVSGAVPYTTFQTQIDALLKVKK